MKLLKYALLASVLFNCSLFSSNNAWAATTLSESPANIVQGGTVTVMWSGIAATTPKDWIGLYAAGAGDGSYQSWIYVSCTRTPGSAKPSGSCPFPIPSILTNGAYELRLFASDGFARLATSNQFNISNVPLRFVDNGDGTITDNQTGLMWEKKTDSVSNTLHTCTSPLDCSNVSNVNNQYAWTVTGTAPDGSVFTNFLELLNGELCSFRAVGIDGTCHGLGNHTDWRLPTLAELQTIQDCSYSPSPSFSCVDPIFQPTYPAFYWSSTTLANTPNDAWLVDFSPAGNVSNFHKTDTVYFARAVRGGR